MLDHLDRVQRAIDFIEARLGEETLTLEAVAAEAGYSSWHFQRLFGAIVGDSLKGYVRRRRLTLAYEALAGTDQRVIDLALASGYESQEAFTRAFRAQFGVPPGAVRRGGAVPPAAKPRITRAYLDHLSGGLSMEPKIVAAPARRMVGLSTRFISILARDRDNHVVIPKLWDELVKRFPELWAAAVPGATYGIVAPLPEGSRRRPDEFWYLAGAAYRPGAPVPPGMELKDVPAGRYAVFTHKGPLANLEHTMRYIFASWLPQSGYELREAPDVEVYDDRFDPARADAEMDIQIPVK